VAAAPVLVVCAVGRVYCRFGGGGVVGRGAYHHQLAGLCCWGEHRPLEWEWRTVAPPPSLPLLSPYPSLEAAAVAAAAGGRRQVEQRRLRRRVRWCEQRCE